MSTKRDPFNIQLIDPNKSRLAGLLPVQSMDIYDTDGNFHPQGLYSTEVFGKPGEKTRMTKHGYIDMRTEVLHPKLYLELSRLKNLYGGILAGTAYAIWDNEIKDFVKSDILDGKTGYSFFMEHFADIQFARNDSDKREQRLMLIEKYRSRALYRYLVVLPAGLREVEVETDGRTTEDEINGLYRKVMRVANTIAVRSNNSNDPLLDTSRWALQSAFNEIYDYLQDMVEGKKGFILSKWGTRSVHGGTRNVITATDAAPEVLGAENSIGVNHTLVGLHQYLKGTVPLSIHGLKTSFFGEVINQLPGSITLVNRETLKPEVVVPQARTKERWGTAEGLEELINGFEEVNVRHKPVTIEGRYLGLIYQDNQYFKLMRSIEELGEGFSSQNVRPITWAELYYFAVYEQSKKVIAYVTRYPVTGAGSIYPCYPYLRVTNRGLTRRELTEDWRPTEKVWYEMPNSAEHFYDSMGLHASKLEGLGAD